MTTVWIRDLDQRIAYIELPLVGSRETVERAVRAALPNLVQAEGLRGLKAWGIVDARETARRRAVTVRP